MAFLIQRLHRLGLRLRCQVRVLQRHLQVRMPQQFSDGVEVDVANQALENPLEAPLKQIKYNTGLCWATKTAEKIDISHCSTMIYL